MPMGMPRAGPPTMLGMDGTPIGSQAEWNQYAQRYIQSGMANGAGASSRLQASAAGAQGRAPPLLKSAPAAPAKGGGCSIM